MVRLDICGVLRLNPGSPICVCVCARVSCDICHSIYRLKSKKKKSCQSGWMLAIDSEKFCLFMFLESVLDCVFNF